MNLQGRINLMKWLGDYISNNDEEWQAIKEKAHYQNGWFTVEFIDTACNKLVTQFLNKDLLTAWANHYHLDDNLEPKNVGIVMAGNIPLVGFHDFLCVFISGHKQTIKLSSKDNILLRHIVTKMMEQEPGVQSVISFAETLKSCDAYIATGSNNSSRYFEQYFSRFPHIIRRNRTSAAILSGNETPAELEKLSEDIHLYFGLGCRNVSKIFVPRGYNFKPLLDAFHKYLHFIDHNKYKNNYDYQLSLILLNNIYYMTNGQTLLTENQGLFSPISHLYFEYYEELDKLKQELKSNPDLQCLVGAGEIGFGEAQDPGLFSYADGVDTMQFLLGF